METIICKCIAFFLVVFTLPVRQEKETKNAKEIQSLIGIWGKDINENATFDIKKDSMYYVDANKSVKYWIKENTAGKDSIFIDYGGSVYRGIFYFRNDSLIIRDQRSEHKFVRIK